MRLHLKLLVIFLTAISSFIHGHSQELKPKTSLFTVGIENTRLVYGQYTYKNHLTAKLNFSVYSEKLSYQYLRVTIGYQYKIRDIGFNGEYFFGSALNGNYYNTGAQIKADATFFKRLLLDASLVPWYDSGFGYKTCFEAKIGCKITRNINIKAGYTTVPEYRMSEQRILGGFDFHVSHLFVSPYLSIGTKSSQGGKNIRVLFTFGYQF